ncbi:MAG TPA: stage II sporulation protein M [Prolixibacteraceae bacterium]|nr:stage II sporulation protein M [Prolixibacteraceae bacterium]
MNEIQFLHKNIKKWEAFEALLNNNQAHPDKLSELFIHLTDDLAYSRTYFPNTKATEYLNQLTQKAHLVIYQNQPIHKNKILAFWTSEFPLLIYNSRKEILVSFVILVVSVLIGIVSNKYDSGFTRIIMGDAYVNMSLENIQKGDPLAVYKSMNQVDMFLGITVNNIRVSFIAFVMGIFTSVGTAFIMLRNGIMLGTFHSFLAEQGFLLDSIATVWVHGTYEIFAIVVAGGAGIVMGNSIVFPKSYSRIQSFKQGARRGVKMIIGLIPVFVIAGFLEGFVTRYTQAPYFIRFAIIGFSLLSIVYYFYFYPLQLLKKLNHGKQTN